LKLDGRVAIVTGGAGAIGSAISTELDREGAKVIVADLNGPAAEAVAATLQRAEHAELDVSNSRAWSELVTKVRASHGQLDILVNNAATHHQSLVEDTSDADWDRVTRTNAYSVFYGCRAVISMMKVQRRGAIVNIVTGQFGVPLSSVYTASKFLIEGFSKCLALEVGRHGIRVNTLAPGTLPDTGFNRWYREKADLLGRPYEKFLEQTREAIPLGRFGTPEDIAKGVLYLVSDDSSYVTGHLLEVAGGFSGYASALPLEEGIHGESGILRTPGPADQDK
jgi:NAD(P)-dependent dehydrogenase (short-subunit alcohol dehydrogenase family)